MTSQTVERIDDRRNMSPVDDVFFEIDALYEEAKNWADGAEIENGEQHDAAKAVHDAIHEAGKKADEFRVKEKKPLDDQIKVIQDRYNPYIQKDKGKVDKAKAALKPVLAQWRAKVEAEKRAAAEQAAKEAEEKRLAAEAAMQTSTGNLKAREQAEELLSDAKSAAKDARKAGKAATAGIGLRTYYEPHLTDLRAAVGHYWSKDPQAFKDLIQKLAEADIRAGCRKIPGFEIKETKRAV